MPLNKETKPNQLIGSKYSYVSLTIQFNDNHLSTYS